MKNFRSVEQLKEFSWQYILSKFWEKVDKEGPVHPTHGRCWVWIGGIQKDGYGVFSVHGKKIISHRFSLELKLGHPIAGVACHQCDTPRCINPDHLFDGTVRENIRDCVSKGRFRKYNKWMDDKCKRGHPHIKENIYFRLKKKEGRKLMSWYTECRVCAKDHKNIKRRSLGIKVIPSMSRNRMPIPAREPNAKTQPT